MVSRHERTLAALFESPTPATIPLRDIEAMFVYFGAVVKEGKGSAVRISMAGRVAVFHRPHPRKEAPHRLAREAREFCEQVGLYPEGR